MTGVTNDNSGDKSINVRGTAIIVVVLLIWLLAGGLAMAIYSHTVVELWIPLSICSVAALLSGIWLWKPWRKMTDSDLFLPNYICHFVFSGVILLAVFFSLNRFLASGPEYDEQVKVERKYSEKKYRNRRVGRNRYVRGEAYYEYYAEISLPDGRVKQLRLELPAYNRTRTGSTMTIRLRSGFFGFPVIDL